MPTLLDPGLDPLLLFNGSCARCNAGSPLYAIDVHVPYEGIMALCTGCIYDIALTAGIVMPDAANKAKK